MYLLSPSENPMPFWMVNAFSAEQAIIHNNIIQWDKMGTKNLTTVVNNEGNINYATTRSKVAKNKPLLI